MTLDPLDLERLIDQSLRELPQPHAPRTLLPRVMAAVGDVVVEPWYSRGWFTWPRMWQAAFATALLLVVTGAAWLLPTVSTTVLTGLPDFRIPLFTDAVAFPAWISSMWSAARVLWRVLVEPVWSYVIVFMLIMSAACVAFGTALDRVALGGAIES
jgi:hypothetical protein